MERTVLRFAQNIRVYRGRKGMTQEQLAMLIPVSRQTVSLWEKGVSSPDAYTIVKLANIFGITTDKLLLNREPEGKVDFVEENYIASSYIKSICKAGYYDILQEDLEEFCTIFAMPFERIMAIVLCLHEAGYQIVSTYANGFGLYLKSDQEAEKFVDDMDGIIDKIIHGEEPVTGYEQEIAEKVGAVESEVIEKIERNIYGKDVQTMYYWLDEFERIRGYGKTEEECRRQAEEQNCQEYTIQK